MAAFMCHDTTTADKFYSMNLSTKQVAEHRDLFEAAAEGEDTHAPERPTSTPLKGKSPLKCKAPFKGKVPTKRRRGEERQPTSSSDSTPSGSPVAYQESGTSHSPVRKLLYTHVLSKMKCPLLMIKSVLAYRS